MLGNIYKTINNLIKGKKVLKFELKENIFYDAHYENRFNGCFVYYLKFKGLEKNIKAINTLIMGSSHGVYGYIPQHNEFNLCFPSQDLYYAFKLYEKYRFDCKSLSKIILFYSVFSPGFELYESSEKWRCVWYKMFFNVDSPKKSVNILSDLLVRKLNNKIKKICAETSVPLTYRGENIDLEGICTFKDTVKYPANKRALDHFRNNVRSNEANKYLVELANLIQKDKRKLYVIIPPMQEEFRKWLTSDNMLFKELYKLSVNNNFKILNFYSNLSFSNTDFFDFDHLNKIGAEKLTKLIHENMYL